MKAHPLALLFLAGVLLNAKAAAPARGDWGWIHGVAYAPFRDDDAPGVAYPTQEEVRQDLRLLGSIATRIRTYSMNDVEGTICGLARRFGMSCYAGAHISDAPGPTFEEILRLIAAAKRARPAGLIVGSEKFLHRELCPEQVLGLVRFVKQRTKVPVGYAEEYSVLLSGTPESPCLPCESGSASLGALSELVENLDFLMVHIHPYWDGVPVETAATYVYQKWMEVKAAYPGKDVIIGETGWPSAGSPQGAAIPSEENQRRFLEEWSKLALEKNIPYFLFEAFDEAWKRDASGVEAEAHWGVWNADRTMKPLAADFFTSPPPLIEIHQTARCGGGSDRMNRLKGRVRGVADPSAFAVVLYARTNKWWVQPWCDAPFTPVRPNHSWTSSTHLGEAYAAALVRRTYGAPPCELELLPGAAAGEFPGLPDPGGDVLAVTLERCE